MIYTVVLIIYLIIPIVLYKNKQHKLMTIWILQGLFLDIFSVQYHGNISSLKITGLFLTLVHLKRIKELIENPILKLLIIQILYISVSFLVFAYIIPWENTTNFPRINVSYIKGVKQIITNVSEFGCILYLGRFFSNNKNIQWGAKVLLTLGIVCALSILLEWVTNIDFFHFFTNGRELLLPDRARGFTFEPRAASQYMAYFLLFLLIIPTSLYIKLISALLAIAGFIAAKSMTGIIILISGAILTFIILFVLSRNKIKIASKFGLLILVTIVISIINYKNFEEHVRYRLYFLNETKFENRFEHADYGAVSFLKNNPQSIIFGVGTGQSALVTSKYKKRRGKISFPDGYTYLPFMGVVLDIINGGLALLFWKFYIIILGIKSIIRNKNFKVLYRDSYLTIAIVFSLLYFLQVRYMHILGISLFVASYYSKYSNKLIDRSTQLN